MANVPEYAYPDTMSRIWARGNYALWAVALLSLVVVGMCWQSVRLTRLLEQKKPLWFFVDVAGRTHDKDYAPREFKQNDPWFEIVAKRSLSDFVELQFKVNRKSIAYDLPAATKFMAVDLSSKFEAAYRSGYINTIIHDSGPDASVLATNVGLLESLTQCGEPGQHPCRTMVQFTRTVDRESSDCFVDIQFSFAHDSGYLIGITDFETKPQCGAAKQAANVR